MSSPETQTAASGRFAPLTDGPVRTDRQFDLQNLSAEEREVLTADEFIIYGKANIEQWNEPAPGEDPIYIEMEALEERLDQLLALDNLSRRHDDTKVGDFRAEHTLESDATIHLDDGETLRFGAGETLRTGVIREGEALPGDNGTADEDALWLVANVYGKDDTEGSVLSYETRLGAYYGHLDGFSVTVYRREYDDTDRGAVISELDFLAVTIGEDELIKNKGSTFGVAEFQALFAPTATDDAGQSASIEETAEVAAARLRDRLTMGVFKNLFSQSREGLVSETIRTAQEEEVSLDDAASTVAGDDADHIQNQAEERLESISERLDGIEEEEMGRDDLAAEVADELGMDVEQVHALFAELEAAMGEDPEMPAEDDDEDDENDDGVDVDVEADAEGGDAPESTESVDISAEALQDRIDNRVAERVDAVLDEQGVVTEDDLDERMDGLSQQLDEMTETLSDNLTEQMDTEELADHIMSQMGDSTETPDPAGGNATNESDLKAEVDSVVDNMAFGQE